MCLRVRTSGLACMRTHVHASVRPHVRPCVAVRVCFNLADISLTFSRFLSSQRRRRTDGGRGVLADDGDCEERRNHLLVYAGSLQELLQVPASQLPVRRAGLPADVRFVESQQQGSTRALSFFFRVLSHLYVGSIFLLGLCLGWCGLISSLVMSMMISGGLVVCPAEIGSAASSHPPVRPCAISSPRF